jgi:sarcosine oxidase subunit alpha
VSTEAEHAAVTSGVGCVDVSAMTKFRLWGSGVSAFAERVAGSDAARQIRMVFAFDHTIACRLAADHLLVLASTVASGTLQDRLAGLCREIPRDTPIEHHDATCALAGFQLVGPNARAVLRRLVQLDLSEKNFPARSCAETSCAGIHATLVRGEPGDHDAFRVYVAWDLGEFVWERILQAGDAFGIIPVGMNVWRRLTGHAAS